MQKRYITNLTKEIIEDLENIIKNNSKYRSRDRARAILLSYRGADIEELAKIFNRSRRTIERWLNRFNEYDIEQLHDLPGTGRKATLQRDRDEKKVKSFLKNSI